MVKVNNPKIAIVSCVWNRQERLEYTLTQLSKQTNKDFHLYLISNNNKLHSFVEEKMNNKWDYTIVPIYNSRNYGPYARSQTMYKLGKQYEYYLTLDDDALFDNRFIEQWYNYLEPNKVKGWNGFNFIKGENYWTRKQVDYFDNCHYIWGSNLLIPNSIIDNDFVLLPERYWNCDDLFICYYANSVKKMELQKVRIENFSINIDGKDTYISQQNIKIEFLELLRKKGWNV